MAENNRWRHGRAGRAPEFHPNRPRDDHGGGDRTPEFHYDRPWNDHWPISEIFDSPATRLTVPQHRGRIPCQQLGNPHHRDASLNTPYQGPSMIRDVGRHSRILWQKARALT